MSMLCLRSRKLQPLAESWCLHRGMRGDEARKLCAKDGVELQLVQVPTSHGKADLTLYRQNSKQVLLLWYQQQTQAALLPEQGLAEAYLVTASSDRSACMHDVGSVIACILRHA